VTGRTAGAKVLFLVGSVVAALSVCEVVLRLAGDRLVAHSASGSFAIAATYVRKLPVAPGVDRAWFLEKVPDLTNRSPVDPQLTALYQEYGKRGIYGPQSFYVFNRVYIEQAACRQPTFSNFPPNILVFDPPLNSPYPRYRFLAGETLPSGLVTNAFGWRGAEIPLQKPPGTIRIAFVGASTTIDPHDFAHSYPELVGYWFNRYFRARSEPVKVDVINAGREGIGSTDIEAIVRSEIGPAEPDFVVYYEGANQFNVLGLLERRSSDRPARPEEIPELPRPTTSMAGGLALGRLFARARANWLDRRREPPKPAYDLSWPSHLSESTPDISRADLPLDLGTVLRDLDSISGVLKPMGARLILSSFVWLPEDGMVLSAAAHRHIYNQVNLTFWPVRYRDIRRMADFQNRVLEEYARSRGVPFADVAAAMPRNPDLFSDAIHMTEEGCRLRAWIVFQSLLPIVRRDVDEGRLPQAPRARLERHPWISDPRPMRLDCSSQAEAR
jgi:hypothetical protein